MPARLRLEKITRTSHKIRMAAEFLGYLVLQLKFYRVLAMHYKNPDERDRYYGYHGKRPEKSTKRVTAGLAATPGSRLSFS